MWKRAHWEGLLYACALAAFVSYNNVYPRLDFKIMLIICPQFLQNAWKVFKGMPGIRQAMVSLDAHWQAAKSWQAFGEGRISTHSSHISNCAAINLSWSSYVSVGRKPLWSLSAKDSSLSSHLRCTVIQDLFTTEAIPLRTSPHHLPKFLGVRDCFPRSRYDTFARPCLNFRSQKLASWLCLYKR